MKTMDSCFEDWRTHGEIFGGRMQIQVPSPVTLMLKVNSNEISWVKTTCLSLDCAICALMRLDDRSTFSTHTCFKSIAAAGFSQRFPWQDDAVVSLPKNHILSFRSALHIVLEKILWKIALPEASRTTITRSLKLMPLIKGSFSIAE